MSGVLWAGIVTFHEGRGGRTALDVANALLALNFSQISDMIINKITGGEEETAVVPKAFTADTPVTKENFRDLLAQAGIEHSKASVAVLWGLVVNQDSLEDHTPSSIIGVFVEGGVLDVAEKIEACVK